MTMTAMMMAGMMMAMTEGIEVAMMTMVLLMMMPVAAVMMTVMVVMMAMMPSHPLDLTCAAPPPDPTPTLPHSPFASHPLPPTPAPSAPAP